MSQIDDRALTIEDLSVRFGGGDEAVHAVRGVTLSVRPGEIVALVGESGSGKSVTALTALGLTRSRHTQIAGRVLLDGHDLTTADDAQLRTMRGARIAMVFQDPLTSLNPTMRIGRQIVEMIELHEPIDADQAHERAVALLSDVGIPAARQRVDAYPHELSGGMRQRAMIAMAMACSPRILVADEPTTALDVTIQGQILALIRALVDDRGSGVLLITHDLGAVASVADRVAVMYAGRIVEVGTCAEVFADPQHPYTWGLLGSIPRVDRPRVRRLSAIAGQPPSLAGGDVGCSFAARCPHAFEACARRPALVDRIGDGHADACHLPIEHRPEIRVASMETRHA
jgi:peptide/nickel transport system ATP-binding protein